MTCSVTPITDAPRCRARRLARAIARRADLAAEAVHLRAMRAGLSRPVADQMAHIARTRVIDGLATPGRAIGDGYTRIARHKRHMPAGGVA